MASARYISAPTEKQMTTEIHIDMAAIPAHVRDDLAAATLERFKAFCAIPGNVEWLDQRIAARKAAQAAQRKEQSL